MLGAHQKLAAASINRLKLSAVKALSQPHIVLLQCFRLNEFVCSVIFLMFYLHVNIPKSSKGILERAFALSLKSIQRVHAFILLFFWFCF